MVFSLEEGVGLREVQGFDTMDDESGLGWWRKRGKMTGDEKIRDRIFFEFLRKSEVGPEAVARDDDLS